jgi:hypothetical protein
MKKTLFTVMAVAVMITGSFAQSAQMKIKAKETEIPVTVVQSFKKDFAGSMAEGWAVVPAKVVGEEYVVTGYDNLDGTTPDHYSVRMKGTNMKGEALYNKDGKLMYFKEKIKDTALPAAVTRAITEKYPGYTVAKDQETIKEGKTTLTQYCVLLEKGVEKKIIAIDPNGMVLKEKTKK